MSASAAILEFYLGDEPVSVELPGDAIDSTTFPARVNGREFATHLSGVTVTVEARLRGMESVFLLAPLYWFRGIILDDEKGRKQLTGSLSLIPVARWFFLVYFFAMFGAALLGAVLFVAALLVVDWSDRAFEMLVLVGMAGVCLLFGYLVIVGTRFLFATVRRDLKNFIHSVRSARHSCSR